MKRITEMFWILALLVLGVYFTIKGYVYERRNLHGIKVQN